MTKLNRLEYKFIYLCMIKKIYNELDAYLLFFFLVLNNLVGLSSLNFTI